METKDIEAIGQLIAEKLEAAFDKNLSPISEKLSYLCSEVDAVNEKVDFLKLIITNQGRTVGELRGAVGEVHREVHSRAKRHT